MCFSLNIYHHFMFCNSANSPNFSGKLRGGGISVQANHLMKIQFLPRNPSISILKKGFHSGFSPICSQVAPGANRCSEELVSKILSRKWTLMSPETKIHEIMVSVPPEMNEQSDKFENILFSNNSHPSLGESVMERNNGRTSFYIIRDDLLHPLVNGNKARKLDALFPLVEDHAVTDVVTCGGCQSAHAAAVAVSCAERGLKSHLLLRGEQPQVLTGYTLISMLYGNVIYIPRTLYANRKEMLARQAYSMAGSSGSVVWLSDLFVEMPFTNHTSANPYLQPVEDNVADNSKKIVIVNEGAGDAIALLGMIRLMQHLSSDHLFGKEQPFRIVVDAGTGTTAVGLGIGALCLGLPWEVTAVMLADTIDNYKKQEERLIYEFCKSADLPCIDEVLNGKNGRLVHWVERHCPRKFGNLMKGEIERCQQIARQTGVLVDPVYTLAAWELATQLSQEEREGGAKVVMLHTGGTLGMFGLAQRYKSYF